MSYVIIKKKRSQTETTQAFLFIFYFLHDSVPEEVSEDLDLEGQIGDHQQRRPMADSRKVER